MGKVDQGFIVLWMARHLYGGALAYTGFGGEGLQVRDILHVEDLYDLLALQLRGLDRHSGATYNVAGGTERSVSLRELTDWCQRLTGKFLQDRARSPRRGRPTSCSMSATAVGSGGDRLAAATQARPAA
jgi:nucleoside-diphosphate-sugar epimerase